jgi:outer membrane protein assembly factor BamB
VGAPPRRVAHTDAGVGIDGTSYVGSLDGKLYAFSPTRALRYTFTAAAAVSSSPAIAEDGAHYFVSEDGQLRAIGP